MCHLITSVVCFFVLLSLGDAYSCEEENIFGMTVEKQCPGYTDNRDAVYCCGHESDRKCCSTPFGDELEEIAEQMPFIIGIIAAVAFGLILCCILCCCCCPFCILYKRRNRGTVHSPPPIATQMPPQQPAGVPVGGYAPVQQAYPVQPQAYPVQPQGYPVQPQGGFPQQPPYPTQTVAGNPPYPVQQSMTNDQPPAYSEKQQAFNPNY